MRKLSVLTWIGNAFPNDISKAGRAFMHPFYCLYGIERAGRLTGRRFFGEHDWYRVGCEYLVSIQEENGSWNGHNQGFDYWFGLPYSHDMRMTAPREDGLHSAAYYAPKPEYWDVPLMRDGEVIERPVDHHTLTKRYTDEAVKFVLVAATEAILAASPST